MKKSNKFLWMIGSFALVLAMALQLVIPSSAEANRVVDDNTIQHWQHIIDQDTKNIGRIWTDKTVSDKDVKMDLEGTTEFDVAIEDSQFLVTYSALSSTSNTSTTVTKPLDISIVMDISGSMNNNLQTVTTYQEVYNINTNSTYYVLVDGTYRSVNYNRSLGWRYRVNRVYYNVEPKTSANDTTAGRVQFYSRTETSVRKITALKDSVKSFIDQTAQQNSLIQDETKRHQLSLITFSSSGTIYQQWTVPTTDNKEDLKNTVELISVGGATGADYGLQSAIDHFKETKRTDSQKVVIFFTDGEPNHYNGFDQTVANDAITNAKTLKDDGTWVYSIGVFTGADPSDTQNQFNAYMHAVSSNYPDATSYTQLGDRKPNSNYYKAATNADELDSIFNDISQEINTGNQFPTETQDGFAGESGFLTYTDRLGPYMKVDDFKALIFADTKFVNPTKVESNDVITYTFEGKVDTGGNVLYPEGDVNEIDITVTKGQGSEGDLVQIRIPGGMIPLRQFTVTNQAGQTQMSINEALPLRVFYGVSLREDAMRLLRRPDSAMTAYINNHNDGNGNVYFYANDFDLNHKDAFDQDAILGKATSEFTPAATNSFYYFTQDTMIYADNACTQPAKDYIVGKDYYYKKPYYAYESKDSKNAVLQEEIIRFNASALGENRGDVIRDDQGNVYIKSGAPRLTRVADTRLTKTTNKTGTATEVINPHWDSYTLTDPKDIIVYLGNNGRLAVGVPGTLKVSKTVTTNPEAITAPDQLFTFKFDFTDEQNQPAVGPFEAQIFEGQTAIGEMIEIRSGESVQIKANQSIYIYGLGAGITYTVTETDIPQGFSTDTDTKTGTISSGNISEVSFNNLYTLNSVKSDPTTQFRYQKVLEGREWLDADLFEFVLIANSDQTPLPTPTQDSKVDGLRFIQTVTNGDIGSFGEIEYTRPGEYYYTVIENKTNRIPGVTFDTRTYIIKVDVRDNGLGQLEIVEYTLSPSTSNIAVFTNTYSSEKTVVRPSGYKYYIDASSTRPLQANMFMFELSTVDVDAPMPEDFAKDANGRYVTTTNIGNGADQGRNIFFDEISFEKAHVRPEPYIYTVKEIIPENTTGITYDDTVWTISVTVTENNENSVTVTPVFMKDGVPTEIEAFAFENTYTPVPTTIGQDGKAAITGFKVLTGRAMNENEVYEFTLTPTDGSTTDVFKATVANALEGEKKEFNFGTMTFEKPGIYSYMMKETAPKDGSGLTVDKTEHTVQVVVTDTNPGQPMDVSITYDGQAEPPTFINTYQASLNYRDVEDALIVTKTLNGRDLARDEFSFKLEATNDEMIQKLGQNSITFTNTQAKDGKKASMKPLNSCVFTQEDAGKVFTMKITEEEGNLGGVTYDNGVFTVEILITDNGDGTLTATTTPSSVDFVNEYRADPVIFESNADVSPKLAKRLHGRDWQATDSFKFKIEPIGNVPIPQSSETIVSGNYKDGEAVPFGFGDFRFEEEGDYQYKITEERGDIKNITYSTQETILTIKVRDNKEGKLTAEPSYNTNYYFDNFYQASFDYNTKAGVEITKTLQGHALSEGQFEYTLKALDQASASRLNISLEHGLRFDTPAGAADTAVPLSPSSVHKLVLTQADLGKVYAYEIQEVIPEEAVDNTYKGVTYDTTKYRLTIEAIYDEATGEITSRSTLQKNDGTPVEVMAPEKVQMPFVNSYKATGTLSGQANLQVTKVIDGRQWLDTDTFTFTLTTDASSEDVTLPETNTITITDQTPNHTAHFGDITFNKAGAYRFVISENKTNIPGMTDANAKEFIINVADNHDGTLSAVPAGNPNFTFVNTYRIDSEASTTENLDVQKVLTGREWLENESFSFILEANDDVTKAGIANGTIILPENVTTQVTGQDGTAQFDAITFKQEGTYSFKVTEQIPAETNGITYDNHEVIYTVRVVDNLHGGLDSSVTVSGDKQFTNTYETQTNPEPFIDQPMTASKVLTGRPLNAEEFTFEVTPKEASYPMPTKTTAKNDAQGNFDFGTITFDAEGEYVYEVREVIPTEAVDNVYHGVTYSTQVYVLTYHVTENFEKGIFEVDRSVTLNGEPVEAIVFENSYKVDPTILSGKQNLAGTKTVVNADEKAPYVLQENDFQFEIKAQNNAPLPETTIVSNDALGNFYFGDIEYTKEDTYYYTISEVNTGKPGISYDGHMVLVRVIVDENFENGTLTPRVEMEGEMSFENTYDPLNVTASISGTKVLTGRDMVDGEFTFTLTPTTESDGFILKDKQPFLQTTNNAQGVFYFGDDAITFTQAGTYSFEIREVLGTDPNITYSEAVYEVIAEVTDNEGVLACAWTNLDQVLFENSYEPFATNFILEGQKTLTGRNLNEGEFTFVMKNMQGDIVSTGTNDQDGKITFEPLTFTSAGTYQYEVYEEKTAIGGISYDPSVILVTVEVIDNNGQLEATANSESVIFNNTYKAKETSVTLSALKQLSGRPLKAGEFTFTLADKNGTVIQEKTNQANGIIPFDTLEFTSEGVYIYTIKEVIGNDKEITYDKSMYQVMIEITDTGEGYLEPKIVLNKDDLSTDSVVFTNTYEKTVVVEKPDHDIADTGDYTTILPSVMLAGVSLAMIGILNKKKKYFNHK